MYSVLRRWQNKKERNKKRASSTTKNLDEKFLIELSETNGNYNTHTHARTHTFNYLLNI